MKKGHNENGVPVVEEAKREVFATVRSVTRSEFWEAHRNGVELSIAFEVFKEDYQKERVISRSFSCYSFCSVTDTVATYSP